MYKRKANGNRGVSRRAFAKTIAVIAAAPMLPSLGMAGMDEKSRDETSRDEKGPAFPVSPKSSQGANDQISPEAESLTSIAREKYGRELTEDQVNAMKQSINGRLRSANAMSQTRLDNAEEPAFVFTPDVE